MERVELIEDLDVRGFCTQGTVGVGGRKARASRFANRQFAILLAAGAIVLSLHAPARPTPNPTAVGSCVDVSCSRKADTHNRRGLVQGEVRSDAKCRKPDLLIIGSPPLSDAALKSLIDQAIVPALVDRFLAQREQYRLAAMVPKDG